MTPDYWPKAKRALARGDATMAGIIRAYPKIALARRGQPFFTLARSIVGQQISVKAAQSVWNRLEAALQEVTPEAVLSLERPVLRACGLSDRKVEYIADLARHFAEGTAQVALAADGRRRGDRRTGAVRDRPLTAEMFLIFNLLRLTCFRSTISARARR